MAPLKCKFCENYIEAVSCGNCDYDIIHIIDGKKYLCGTDEYYCSYCKISFRVNSDNKDNIHIDVAYLQYDDIYEVRVCYDQNRTIIINKDFEKDMIRNSITHEFAGILKLTPQNVHEKIKTYLIFS